MTARRAGSDPVQTGLPLIRGRSENTFHVLHLPQHRTPGPCPAREPPDLQIEDHGEEMHRIRRSEPNILRPEMKELRERCPRKPEAKGNLSSFVGSNKNAIDGKQNDSAQEEPLAVSATMRMNCGKATQPSFHAPKPQTQKR